MQRVLSFKQTPPLAAPLRFFLTAPVFAMAAALVLLWHGPEAFASRWTPAALSLTHLLTLGFLALSMIGALLQILPVVAGVEVSKPHATACIVHLLLTLGALALSAAFLLSAPSVFKAALSLLAGAFGAFFYACWQGVRHTEGDSATLRAIRLALAALALTVGLGITLASAFAWPLGLPLMQMTGLHIGWGLGGWVGLLVAGVAYQVVPMFQITPLYPSAMTRWLAPVLFLLLGAGTACAIFLPGAGSWQVPLPFLLAGAGYAVFAAATLRLLWQRKRPKPETATLFWYSGLVSLLACILLWVPGRWLPSIAELPSYPFALGILFIVGFGYTVINGMLYKIVPFLVWYHLQARLAGGTAKVPNIRQVITESAAKKQFTSHLLALLLLLGASFWTAQLARAAAVAFFVSSCWLWINLLRAARIYRKHLQACAAA